MAECRAGAYNGLSELMRDLVGRYFGRSWRCDNGSRGLDYGRLLLVLRFQFSVHSDITVRLACERAKGGAHSI